MSLEKTYETRYFIEYNLFMFNSEGPNGIIKKGILFQEQEDGHYNLALVEYRKGRLLDDVTSNNNDIVLIFATVIKSILKFMNKVPHAIIEVKTTDEKRLRVYNAIIQRHHQKFKHQLIFFGIIEDNRHTIEAGKSYESFVIEKKKD